MKIEVVPAHLTAQVFPLVEGFLAPALEYSNGEYTLDQVRLFVNQNSWALIVATDETGRLVGAMTISFMNMPNTRVAYVTCTGGKMICNEDTLAQLKRIVRAMGATKIQAAGRDSVVRLLSQLGFKKIYTVIETTL